MTGAQPEPAALKAALRRQIVARRAAVPEPQRRAASAAIAARLSDVIRARTARSILLYASFRAEVATHALIRDLLGHERRVALPRVNREANRLDLFWIGAFPDDCRPGPFGILEPRPDTCPAVQTLSDFDLLLIPGVAFNPQGYRLGYGAGYYDRLLSGRPAAPVIGLAFEVQMVDDLPVDPWDRPVDALCTETSLTWFARREPAAGTP